MTARPGPISFRCLDANAVNLFLSTSDFAELSPKKKFIREGFTGCLLSQSRELSVFILSGG